MSESPLLGKPRDNGNDPFAHLPPYQHPTNGIISVFPRAVAPYAQLMRIDKPAGFYCVYFPFLLGLMYSGCVADSQSAAGAWELAQLALRLIPFNFLLRSAGCTWNDTTDQKFDRLVERSRNRPIARGAVSTSQAVIFMAAQFALALLSAYALLPAACLPHAVVMVVLCVVYPLMKRVTYYPQVVLGIGCAWPVLFSSAAIGIDPWRPSTLSFAGSTLVWCVINDSIYAFQDISDDEKAGVKGMAMKCGDSMKLIAALLTSVQVGLLVLCGLHGGFNPAYYALTVGGVTASMSYYIWAVRLDSPESCSCWFRRQFFLVGFTYFIGLAGQYLLASLGF